MPEKNQVNDAYPTKKEKKTKMCAFSHICFFCFLDCIDQ